MATKPRSEWTAAYRRRVERAEAAGKTRQAARGHVVREHVRRKEVEQARVASGAVKTTSAQRQAIRRFARQQAAKVTGGDPEAITRSLVRFVDKRDYSAFLAVRQERNRRHLAWLRAQRGGGSGSSSGSSSGEADEADEDENEGFEDYGSDVPSDQEVSWYFYH
jgi:hypothetical protein